MTFKILKNDLNTVLHRSVVRFAADANHRNKRVSFKSDVQDSLIKLDIILSADFRHCHSKDKSRAFNDSVSTRTKSKTDFSHLDDGVAVRTRSKSQNKCNVSVQGALFPLHDVVYFKGHEGFNDEKLQLGALECKVYHNVLNSQIDFDRLRQIHYLDKAEEDRENSWKCSKILKQFEDRGEDGNIQHNLLVEWNDIDKTRSRVNFFALSLRNPIPIISFARNNNLLHKMPFRHLTQYCKTKTAIEMVCTMPLIGLKFLRW